MRFSQVPPIYQLFNDLPFSITDEDGKIPYAGNAWCIIEICKIYELEIHELVMFLWLGFLCTTPYNVIVGGAVVHVLYVFRSGPWFNIKMSSYQYRKSHCGDKTVVRSSYLHNGISYTGKTTTFYWIGAQVFPSWGNDCGINTSATNQLVLIVAWESS